MNSTSTLDTVSAIGSPMSRAPAGQRRSGSPFPVATGALAGLLLLWMLALASMPVLAGVSAEITATDPQSDVVLGRDQPFYVRIAYRSDEPVSFWARPYYQGKLVARHRSGASAHYTGTGAALGWFSLGETGEVDEVRIFAGGGKPWREWHVATHPLRVHVSGDNGETIATQAWVQDLQESARLATRLESEKVMRSPTSAGDITLLSGLAAAVLVLFIGAFTAPICAMCKWSGGWRLAAAVPVVLMGLVVLRIVVGTTVDPTSHNLWPFEILTTGIVALGILASLVVARRFAAKAG